MSAPPFLHPISSSKPPHNLTLEQFIQTVLAGISGIDGTLVRPKFQPDPPAQPDLEVNWIAFSIGEDAPDDNAAVTTDAAGISTLARQAGLDIACSTHGPAAQELAGVIRDGFQVPQNLIALQLANMGFVVASSAKNIPELVNERWFARWEFSIRLRRVVQRIYGIPTLLSAHGTIITITGDEQYVLAWDTRNVET